MSRSKTISESIEKLQNSDSFYSYMNSTGRQIEHSIHRLRRSDTSSYRAMLDVLLAFRVW